MHLGLCGAQGAGKTTLAREFVKANPRFRFVATPTSDIMRDMGLDPSKDYPIDVRLKAQREILRVIDGLYSNYARDVVFDRTPLDMLAYMLADVQRTNVPKELQPEIERYIQDVFNVTNKRFTFVVQIPAVLKLPEEKREGKAPHDPAYTEHIQLLITGARRDSRCKVHHTTLPRTMIDLKERTEALESLTKRLILEQQGERMELQLLGQLIH